MSYQESKSRILSREKAVIQTQHHGSGVFFEDIDEGITPDISDFGPDTTVVRTGFMGIAIPNATKTREALFVFDQTRGEVVVEEITNSRQYQEKQKQLQRQRFIIIPSSPDRIIGYRHKLD